jgi:predicted alpha/beta-hydrolase family hydrolase
LDEAWTAVVREIALPDLPLLLGGRSSGARVACRTAAALGAAGVLALAFPLHPPGRPDRSRAAELPTTVPTLVVNGDRDPFGVPTPTPAVQVAIRPGATHDLRKDLEGTAQTVLTWLRANHWATPAT